MARTHLLVLLAAVALAAAQNPLSQIHVDMDALLADSAKVDAAVQCFVQDGDDSCEPLAKIIKSLISEMVKTNCAECSESQKDDVAKFLSYVSKNKPDDMKKLLTKYDPSGEAVAKYGDSWRAKGVNL
ncbi:ejaculatory bulb-specific protein 3-like [Schistocerca gregaria]|uniref:ejaculatory bulb-specific protein 3-like n=1 Tax=Schistocerca gregaria TaxID=7010 RepID=UPI00211F3251|nr:ejaculatory bulb-specific protein 3-like [Schistocerca gregaria]